MRSRGGSTTVRSTSTIATRSNAEKGNETDPLKTLEVRCSGHNQKCTRLTAGTAANLGRAFYTCPLGKDHPEKCKFFKWEDELHLSPTATRIYSSNPRSTSNFSTTVQTLGQSPSSTRYNRPSASSSSSTASSLRSGPGVTIGVADEKLVCPGPGGGSRSLGRVESMDIFESDDDGDHVEEHMGKNNKKSAEPLFTTPPSTQGYSEQGQGSTGRRSTSSASRLGVGVGLASPTTMSGLEGEVIRQLPKDGTTPPTPHGGSPKTPLGRGSSLRVGISERLRAAASHGKRGRVDDDDDEGKDAINEGRTHKKVVMDAANPFHSHEPTSAPKTPTMDRIESTDPASTSVTPAPPFASTQTSSSYHPALSPALSNLQDLSEHLRRQDRLLRTAETMKQGLRKTILNYKEKNEVLERHNEELEKKVKELEERIKELEKVG